MRKLSDFISPHRLTFDLMLHYIKAGENFTFSRFGDGEFNAIFQKPGANCDGHLYYPEMGKQLEAILKSQPDYHIGIPVSERPWCKEVIQWLEENTPDRLYSRSDEFHLALVDNRMPEMFKAINESGRRVILIGAKYLCSEKNPINFDLFIRVDEHNAYKDGFKVGGIPLSLNIENDIILYCAGMTSCVWIDWVYSSSKGKATLIDFGASLDFYVGKNSRSFFNRIKP